MKIIAKTVQEFSEIEAEVSKLHSNVRSQIIIAENKLAGLVCECELSSSSRLYIPKNVVKISVSKRNIFVYSNDIIFDVKRENDESYEISFCE